MDHDITEDIVSYSMLFGLLSLNLARTSNVWWTLCIVPQFWMFLKFRDIVDLMLSIMYAYMDNLTYKK